MKLAVSTIRPVTIVAAVLMLCTAVAPLAAQSARAQEQGTPNTVIIFDGSGSMWGDMARGRDVKFQVARQGLKAAFAQASSLGNVGLTAFGYRQRGTCGTRETISAVERADPQGSLAALDNWNPRGRGPIGMALRSAAEQLRELSAPRRILLLHDDADNCGDDVCAIARSLKADMPDLVIETVTLADPSEPPIMACLAEITGGNVVQSADPDEVDNAIASAVGRITAPTQPAPSATVAPERRQPTAADLGPGVHTVDGPRQLVAVARVTGSDQPLSAPMTWTIEPLASKAPVLSANRSEIKAQLIGGDYRVTARSGSFVATSDVTISDGSTTVLVVEFEAADVGIIVEQPGGFFTRAPEITLRKKEDITPVLMEQGIEVRLLLQPGDYSVSAALGLTETTREFTADPGSAPAIDLSLEVGLVDVAVASNGSPGSGADQPLIRLIHEPATNSGPNGAAPPVEIARSSAPTAAFFVPPGPYRVVLDTGSNEIDRRIMVAPGVRVPVRLDQSGGRLSLRTRIAGNSAPEGEGASYVITADDGRTIRPIRLHDPVAEVLLEPGRYRVTSVLTAFGLRATRTLIVTPGMQEALEIEHEVGTLRLLAPPQLASTEDARVFWDIRDREGNRVWRDIGAERNALLAPGIYAVSALIGGQVRQSTVTVRLGETSDVAF